MSEELFKIGAEGVDTDAIVKSVCRRVEEKMARGAYDDARIARAERLNLVNLKSEDQFLGFYLRCLRDAVYVDISDFEIHERRKSLAPFLIKMKKTIWGLLRFYTYRLWSQQNEVNGLLVTAIESLDEKYSKRIQELEDKVQQLETRLDQVGNSEI